MQVRQAGSVVRAEELLTIVSSKLNYGGIFKTGSKEKIKEY